MPRGPDMLGPAHGNGPSRRRASTTRSTRSSREAPAHPAARPGEKLSLHELAAELGVSRSPVHHALTRLVSEGLLTVKARRGYFVTPVTADALAEGYDVRLALELHAADHAVGRVDPRTLAGVPVAARGHRRGDLARAVGRRERGLPRAPDRPRRERAPLALLPRALRQPDDAGHPWRPPRGPREPRHGAPPDRRGLRGRRPRRDAKRAIRAHVETGKRIALEAIERAGGVL